MLFLPVVPQQQRRCVISSRVRGVERHGSTGGAGIESSRVAPALRPADHLHRMVNTMRCQPRAKSNTIDCYVST